MRNSPVDFASLLCSRLCHDLLSPVGALNNGLELLADETDPAMRQRCLDLLTESARASANKLKFFRLAFGVAGGFGETIDPREAKSAIEGLLVDGKGVTLGWMVDDEGLPKAPVKVLLNLALIAVEALVRGGSLDIGVERNDAGVLEIVIRAQGPRLVLDDQVRATMEGGGEPPTARTAAAHLVHTLVKEDGGTLQVVGPEDGVLVFGAAFVAPRRRREG